MATTVHGARPPSHTAYYVALGGIVLLLFLLCCYFFYFCVKRVKELTKDPEGASQPVAAPAPPSYPVPTAVRDSATAMAKLCKLPPPGGKGDTVFPAASSPAALPTDTGGGGGASPAHATSGTDKMPAPAAARMDQGSAAAR